VGPNLQHPGPTTFHGITDQIAARKSIPKDPGQRRSRIKPPSYRQILFCGGRRVMAISVTMGYLTLFPPPPVPGTPPAESKRVRPVPRQDGPAYCPPRSPDRVRACDWPSAESRLSSARGLGCCSWQSHGSAGRAERRRPADGHGRGIAPTFRKERQQWINEWTDGLPRSLRQRR
jgi:hypothetical protein